MTTTYFSTAKRNFFSALILFLFILAPSVAVAQTRDMVKEAEYIRQLQALDPSLVKSFEAGTSALDQGNYVLADSLYSIIYRQAPSFIPVVRRLGSIRYALGQHESGIELCQKALSMERSSANILSLAQLLMFSGEKDPARQKERLNLVRLLIDEGIVLEPRDDFDYTVLKVQMALQLNQLEDFKNATAHLLAKHNDQMLSHYFAAILAANNEEWQQAESEIYKARDLGMNPADVEAFLDSGVNKNLMIEKAKVLFIWLGIAWVLGFVVLYFVGMFLSNYTLSAIEREFSSKSSTKLAHYLRTVYRFLINTAGMYYYISLPFVLILLIVVVGGIIYLFLMAGHVPIKLTALLVIGAVITIYSMIRSLLLKVKYTDPGRELKEEEAPALFALTREVAATMGTRAIDEIRITPDTDLAVYETGSWRNKLRDKGKRILILGAGVLKDFKQEDFKAVLAHEYGHFSHRDTAGGAVAMQVKSDMHKYYHALYNAGQAVAWNLAFQFIRLYDFIFRRISNGATRLQEVLADRVAAQTYGASAFENGLTHVIKRNIEFTKLANIEIEDARKIKRSFNNLYELDNEIPGSFDEEVQKSLNRATSKDDTHPSPVDRFRLIKGLGDNKITADKNIFVKDLFANWTALTLEMTKKVQGSWNDETTGDEVVTA